MSAQDPFGLGEPQARPAQASRQVDLKEYWYLLRRRWRLIAAAVALTTTAGVVHYLVTPKEYVATTQIQIERRSLGIAGEQMPWLENWWNMEYYPTQYELLKSRGLAEEVVLMLDLPGDPAVDPGGDRGDSVEGSRDEHADRAALGRMADRLRSNLSVSPVRSTQLVRLSYRYPDPVFAARAANAFATAFIDRGVTRRRETVGRAQRFLVSQVADLQQEISALEEQKSALSRDANLVGTQNEGSVGSQRLAAANSDYLDARRARISAQSRYEEAVASPSQVTASRYAREVIDPLLREQEALEQDHTERSRTFKSDWPPLIELGQEVERGRREVDEAISREARRSVQNLYSEYQAALREERRLEQDLDRLKEELHDQSSAASQLGNLEMEVETRRELLNDMLRRQSEASVAARQQSSDLRPADDGAQAAGDAEVTNTNVSIVDRALVPTSPAYPSLRQALTFGGVAGLLLGISLVVLLEFLDRTVKSAEEAEKLLALPVLAVIPSLSDSGAGARNADAYGYGERSRGTGRSGGGPRSLVRKKQLAAVDIELIPHGKPRLAISEAYRTLRTSLMLSTADELGVVAVTSARAGEGKTVTAINLAVVLAQLQRRVLLMDCDLRKPRLHRVFNVSNRQGVVTALAGGKDSELPLFKTAVDGLFVAPSGPHPPNPSELLASPRMADLIASLKKQFDFVVIDTPPVLPVTDALLIGSLADGTALCLRAGQVQRDEAQNCRDRLQMADVKILGLILNGYSHARGGSGRRYQYYETYAEEAEAGSAA